MSGGGGGNYQKDPLEVSWVGRGRRQLPEGSSRGKLVMEEGEPTSIRI